MQWSPSLSPALQAMSPARAAVSGSFVTSNVNARVEQSAPRQQHAQINSLGFRSYRLLIGSDRRSLAFWFYRLVLREYRRLRTLLARLPVTGSLFLQRTLRRSAHEPVGVGTQRDGMSRGGADSVTSTPHVGGSISVDATPLGAADTADGAVRRWQVSPGVADAGAGAVDDDVDYADGDAGALLRGSVDELDVAQLRRLARQAQSALRRQCTRVAQLQSSRTLLQQVHDAEARLRLSAEQSASLLESELARVRARNTALVEQVHARDVQLARLTQPHTGAQTPQRSQ